MRYTKKRNGKNVIPLLNAVCSIDMPYWRIDRADDLHSYLSGDAADKLAAYEDTGLEPEICKDIKSLCDDYVDAGLDASFILACIAAARAGISSKRMTEISKAETDNRLIILPCKIGTDCWRVNFNRRRHPIEQIRFDVTSYNAFGKTVFLTSAEAKAALKGEREDGT